MPIKRASKDKQTQKEQKKKIAEIRSWSRKQKSVRKKKAATARRKKPKKAKPSRKPSTSSQKGGGRGRSLSTQAKTRASTKKGRTSRKTKKIDSRTRRALMKRGIIPLTKNQRSTYYRLKRKVGAKRRLTADERKTWERLSKQVLKNKQAGALISSANKKSARKAKSNASGRRNKVKNARKATVAKAKRKGRGSRK